MLGLREDSVGCLRVCVDGGGDVERVAMNARCGVGSVLRVHGIRGRLSDGVLRGSGLGLGAARALLGAEEGLVVLGFDVVDHGGDCWRRFESQWGGGSGCEGLIAGCVCAGGRVGEGDWLG